MFLDCRRHGVNRFPKTETDLNDTDYALQRQIDFSFRQVYYHLLIQTNCFVLFYLFVAKFQFSLARDTYFLFVSIIPLKAVGLVQGKGLLRYYPEATLCTYDIHISFPFSHFFQFLAAEQRRFNGRFLKRRRYSEISRIAKGIFHFNSVVIQPVITASCGGQERNVRGRWNKNKF